MTDAVTRTIQTVIINRADQRAIAAAAEAAASALAANTANDNATTSKNAAAASATAAAASATAAGGSATTAGNSAATATTMANAALASANAATASQGAAATSAAAALASANAAAGFAAPRTSKSASSASPLALNTDNLDVTAFTNLANDLTINADAGAPGDFKKYILAVTSTAIRTLTFTGGVAKGYAPVNTALTASAANWTYATIANKWTYFVMVYNATAQRWHVTAIAQET